MKRLAPVTISFTGGSLMPGSSMRTRVSLVRYTWARARVRVRVRGRGEGYG